jgi:hypothetical protein
MDEQEIIDAITVRQVIYCSDRFFVRKILFNDDTRPNIHQERIWNWMCDNFKYHEIEEYEEELN